MQNNDTVFFLHCKVYVNIFHRNQATKAYLYDAHSAFNFDFAY